MISFPGQDFSFHCTLAVPSWFVAPPLPSSPPSHPATGTWLFSGAVLVSHLPYGMTLLWASPVGCVVRKGFHPGTRPEVGLQFRPERHIRTLKASRLVIIEDAFDFWPASRAFDLCSCAGLRAQKGPVLGFMPCCHCVDMLNDFISELCFVKWSPMKRWSKGEACDVPVHCNSLLAVHGPGEQSPRGPTVKGV